MGGKPKAQELPPTPAPTPMPLPTSSASVSTEGQRAERIKRLKAGMLSTIKTSPSGVVGAGSDLNQGQGSKTLGGS